ncbi:MAG TPA: hypothetical protein VKQ71_15050, partial [Acidimicrobiales bacterium]|nr:hypothetical protein [Acidimicrobiales bacterium]
MGATFRSAATATATAASVTVTAPAGVTLGDQLLAIVWSADDSATFSAPSGWSALGANQDPGSGGSHVPTQLFQKVATASEPANYKFTSSVNNQALGGAVLDYSGGTVDAQNTKNTGTSTAASLAAASVTTTQGSETVVAFWVQALGAGAGITLPGGVTTRASVTNYSGKALSLNVGDYTGPGTPGSSAPGTATGDTTYWASLTVCLKTPAPAAPTLLTPANSSYLDVQSLGGPFTWQYNSNGSAGGETAYGFRRKISGGSYSYWNAGTPAFQGTDTTNTTTSTTVTFGVSVWTDGNVYNWSVKSVDAGGTGPYAADFVLNSQAAPSVTVSAPTGTYSTNQTPTVTWSDSLASGGSQLTYRVVTYSAAQYGAPGFTPGSGPSLDDSGVVNSSATSYTVVNPIPSGTTCESYVQIVQTPGSQASAWSFTSFTVTVDTPATPTITAVAGNDGTTGCPR